MYDVLAYFLFLLSLNHFIKVIFAFSATTIMIRYARVLRKERNLFSFVRSLIKVNEQNL